MNRIDVELVRRNMVESRAQAQALIMAGHVYSNTRRIDKPSDPVGFETPLRIVEQPRYVSRGGLKLEKALDAFNIQVTGVALDIGAATGGFTDVLLQRGAVHVYAIDVGYGQLHTRLRADPRVTVMERVNARFIQPDDFPVIPVLTVMDVSFISIRLIVPAAIHAMQGQGRIIALIKPQFEAGRDQVGKKGVVRDPAVHETVLLQIRDMLQDLRWCMNGLTFSPITGPEGNIEFLIDATNSGGSVTDIKDIVHAAHEFFHM